MVLASQLRAGMAIRHEGLSYKVMAADYHPGQAKMGGVTHARLRNLDTGTIWEHGFRSDLRFEEIPIDKQALEFLYTSGDQYCFMNAETFEQTEIGADLVGPQAGLLEAGMKVSVEFVEGRPTEVLLPEVLELRVVETAPAAHQQQDSTFKPARIGPGVEILVPQFIKTGDVVRINVQSMKYMDRAKTKPA